MNNTEKKMGDSKKKGDTREKIMKAAAAMFAERGYHSVTTREIAKAAEINPASIYYHFPSKEDILIKLYEFYTEKRRKEAPDLDKLLRMAETHPPHEVLMQTEFHFDGDIREMLDQIIVTATREINADPKSEQFIRENIFHSVKSVLMPLLERMVELGKIEPFDVETFIRIVSFYGFSSAALNSSFFRQNVIEYQRGMGFLFSIIVPTGK